MIYKNEKYQVQRLNGSTTRRTSYITGVFIELFLPCNAAKNTMSSTEME